MADRPFITIPADQPCSEELADLTLAQKAALPLRFHSPQWVNATPPVYVCRVCWDEVEITAWPCKTAREARDDVFGREVHPHG